MPDVGSKAVSRFVASDVPAHSAAAATGSNACQLNASDHGARINIAPEKPTNTAAMRDAVTRSASSKAAPATTKKGEVMASGQTPGKIALVTPDGDAREVADGLAFPNGMVVTPDNATLIVAESFARRLTAAQVARARVGLARSGG